MKRQSAQFEIVTPQKTHGPFKGQLLDTIRSLGLDLDAQDEEGGWSVRVVGSTPDDSVSTA